MANKNPRNYKGTIGRKDLYTTADLEKIRIVPGLNVRHELRNIPELMELIRASNRIRPLLVRRNTDSDVEAVWDLIGGHRRLEAAKRLMAEGWEGKVSLEEITCTEEEMFVYMAMDNLGREDFSAIEEAEVVVKLERMGWTDADIGKKMGNKALQWVLDRKAIYSASKEVKNEVRKGLAADVGANIARVGGADKQREVLTAAKLCAKKAAEAKKQGKGKGRRDWRQNMRRSVAEQTGKKVVPGKRLMRQVKQEIVEALESKAINGHSKMTLVAIDFALGEITLDEFRDHLGYHLVDDA